MADAIPPEYYQWIVDRFATCIRDKLDPGKRNHTPIDWASCIQSR